MSAYDFVTRKHSVKLVRNVMQESNGPMLIDGEFGFDAYSLGSCM